MSVTTTDRLATFAGRRQPTALGAVGLLATIVALTITAGPVGGLVGVGLALAGLFLTPLAVFGLGQAAVLALLPAPTPLQLALVETALLLVLVGPAMAHATVRLVAGTVGLFALLGTTVWLATQTFGLQPIAITFVSLVALSSYLLHRYERVTVGLAGGDTA